MISISKEANKNYLAKLIQLKGVKKHPNADSLQVVLVDFQQVITGMDAKNGDLYVFFPLECVINHEFLSANNSFRHSHLNKVVDDEKCGFFERWHQDFLKKCEDLYTEKDCYICTTKAPEEGCVVRKESMFGFEAYKLKSFKFLEFETKLLDSGVEDLESAQ